jgi:hypothetical protein
MMVLLEHSLYMTYNDFYFESDKNQFKSNVFSHVQHAYKFKWATKKNILLIFPLKFMYVQI